MQRSRFHLRLDVVLTICCLLVSTVHASMRPAHAQKAMVVSIHSLATDAGVEVMREGGNAIDAAVATGFALAVVHPQAGNIGGGGFMLIRLADGKLHFLDYREKAPAAATVDMYWDKQGNVVPGLSTVGYKAISVPGSVAGMVAAEKKWGKLGLAKVMAPAIHLARDGFPLPWEYANEFHNNKHLGEFPESKRIFQRDGNFYEAGEVFKQPELASTLEKIAANPDDFYHGQIAKQIAAVVQKGGGILTAQDLANYEVKEREVVHGTYRGYDLYSAPPPSSGGVALVEILNILEKFDVGSLGADSAEAMHLTVEAYRRAFMDRADFMGDPDFAKVPVAQLIDKSYANAWRESINPQHASISKDLKRPAGTFNDLDKVARAATAPEPNETTHYSVVDGDGNAVSVTTTLNGSFGSAVTAEGLGFLLNNEMDDFAAKVGVPNMYGLIQGPANAVGANKRPLSAMTPTIVTKDDKLFLVLGSPGGPTIITTVVNVLMGVVDYGLDIQQAVDAARFHNQWLPDKIMVERKRFSPDTLKLLQDEGHTIDDRNAYWGDAECIMIDPKTGERLGGHDERHSYGKAAGF
jgi:gamma-glutamyltranspeptidase/glutathione hydrolase